MLRTLWDSLFRKKTREEVFFEVLADILEGIDDTGGYLYVKEGEPYQCTRCKKVIPLPGVMIPEGIIPKEGSPTSPEGHPYECYTKYKYYHRACAVLELLQKPNLGKFIAKEPKTDKETKNESDSR